MHRLKPMFCPIFMSLPLQVLEQDFMFWLVSCFVEFWLINIVYPCFLSCLVRAGLRIYFGGFKALVKVFDFYQAKMVIFDAPKIFYFSCLCYLVSPPSALFYWQIALNFLQSVFWERGCIHLKEIAVSMRISHKWWNKKHEQL